MFNPMKIISHFFSEYFFRSTSNLFPISANLIAHKLTCAIVQHISEWQFSFKCASIWLIFSDLSSLSYFSCYAHSLIKPIK